AMIPSSGWPPWPPDHPPPSQGPALLHHSTGHDPLTGSPAVANPWRTHANRPKAGDNLALGSLPVAHQALAAILGVLVGVAGEEGCNLRLDGLRQQRSRALAQNLGQRVGEGSWLDQLDDLILTHGVSLLWWRSGGSNTPTICRLNPSRRHQLPRMALPTGSIPDLAEILGEYYGYV